MNEECCNIYSCNGLAEIHFILSKKGHKLLVYQQYTYAKNFVSRSRTNWTCSSRRSKGCSAQVVLTNDDEFTVVNGNHNHPVPVFYMNNREPVLIKGNKKGKYTLLYRNHFFTRRTKSKKGIVWKCTASKTEDCKASLTTDDNLNVVVSKGDHTHRQPEAEIKPKHVYFTTQ
ncbi:unnamed protein product, partial [Iphiclides podalirius]